MKKIIVDEENNCLDFWDNEIKTLRFEMITGSNPRSRNEFKVSEKQLNMLKSIDYFEDAFVIQEV